MRCWSGWNGWNARWRKGSRRPRGLETWPGTEASQPCPRRYSPRPRSLESREAEPRTVTLPKAQLEDLNRSGMSGGKIVREMGMSIRPSFRETVVEPAGDSCLCIVFSDAMNFSMGSRPSILGDLERHVEQAYGNPSILRRASGKRRASGYQVYYR